MPKLFLRFSGFVWSFMDYLFNQFVKKYLFREDIRVHINVNDYADMTFLAFAVSYILA